MSLDVAFGPQIEAAARRHGLDPRLLAAVAAQETGGPGADSGRNVVGDGGHGRGLFQIDDRSHAFASSAAAMDPGANADYAAGMLASLARQYGGDLRATLSAYNSGSPTSPGTLTDWGDGKPVSYADSVLRHYARLTGRNPSSERSDSTMNVQNQVASTASNALAASNGSPGIAAFMATGNPQYALATAGGTSTGTTPGLDTISPSALAASTGGASQAGTALGGLGSILQSLLGTVASLLGGGADAGSAEAAGLAGLTSEQTVAPSDSSLYTTTLDSATGANAPDSTSGAKLISMADSG